MSRSQFQSKRFILRHAWLNLWDERMTTGRINQVAVLVDFIRAIMAQSIHGGGDYERNIEHPTSHNRNESRSCANHITRQLDAGMRNRHASKTLFFEKWHIPCSATAGMTHKHSIDSVNVTSDINDNLWLSLTCSSTPTFADGRETGVTWN